MRVEGRHGRSGWDRVTFPLVQAGGEGIGHTSDGRGQDNRQVTIYAWDTTSWGTRSRRYYITYLTTYSLWSAMHELSLLLNYQVYR